MEILAPVASKVGIPARVYKLRWIMELTDGRKLVSSWLPETRFPSLKQSMEFARDKLVRVIIEGEHLFAHQSKYLLVCEEKMFHKLSYKGFMSLASGRSFTGGIEVEDVLGRIHLVLQDGTIYQEG